MQTPSYKELLDAGCHFGHLKRKWNPKMRQHIFMERNGIHVIDLNSTAKNLEIAAKAARQMAKSGKKILFVGTKKQARDIVKNAAQRVNMPFVTDRWLGGMMTNFATIRRSIRKMQNIRRLLDDESLKSITKKEKLVMSRKYEKLNRVFGGIAHLNRLPNALFIIDIHHEHLAVAEATRLGIKTIGVADTNADPTIVDFAIPSNDDASKAIAVLTNCIADAIQEGLDERNAAKKEKENREAAQ